jgi:hypothetical protein
MHKLGQITSCNDERGSKYTQSSAKFQILEQRDLWQNNRVCFVKSRTVQEFRFKHELGQTTSCNDKRGSKYTQSNAKIHILEQRNFWQNRPCCFAKSHAVTESGFKHELRQITSCNDERGSKYTQSRAKIQIMEQRNFWQKRPCCFASRI